MAARQKEWVETPQFLISDCNCGDSGDDVGVREPWSGNTNCHLGNILTHSVGGNMLTLR